MTAVFVAMAAVGCGEADDDGDVDFTMDNVRVEAHEDNVLSCWVRWTTSQPATSRVEFGEAGVPEYAVGDEELVTEHEVFVFGMFAETEYTMAASSMSEEGEVLESSGHTFTTGVPPFHAVVFEVSQYDPQRVEPGWTLTNLGHDEMLCPPTAVILDMEGRPVWYHRLSEAVAFAGLEVSLLDNGHVLLGGELPPGVSPVEMELSGRIVWEGRPQPEEFFAQDATHHTMQKLASGNYLTLTYDNGATVVGDAIEEWDLESEAVWRWAARDHIEEAVEEHIHINMVEPDEDGGVLYANSYVLNALYKIDKGSGEILWTLGEEGDFEMLTEHDEPWFRNAHAPELQPDGTFLFYDNAGGSVEPYNSSRAIQYAIDEEAMTAEIIWEYPGADIEDYWFNYGWGDADRLPNGNTLVAAGSMLSWDTESRIFEVTPEGDKVWHLQLRSTEGNMLAGSYMAERIPMLLERLD